MGIWPYVQFFPRFDPIIMGRTLESKKQIVEKIEDLLDNSDMALVLDYKGLSTKEMSDLRSRLQQSNGVFKITKKTLMLSLIHI